MGKAYFLLHVLIVFGATLYLRIFDEETYSRWVLRQFVRLLGALLIVHGSHSSLVSGFLLSALSLYLWANEHLPSWYVHIVGFLQRPSYRYSGRKVRSLVP